MARPMSISCSVDLAAPALLSDRQSSFQLVSYSAPSLVSDPFQLFQIDTQRRAHDDLRLQTVRNRSVHFVHVVYRSFFSFMGNVRSRLVLSLTYVWFHVAVRETALHCTALHTGTESPGLKYRFPNGRPGPSPMWPGPKQPSTIRPSGLIVPCPSGHRAELAAQARH